MKKQRATVHKRLQLQHHRHTGRVLHHRHTSYHGLAIVMALAGALILGLGTMAKATADTLTVFARNPAPIPTTPAVIISPANNAVVTDEQLVASGTCEASDPPNIVTILDNGEDAGSTPCLSDGTFSLSIMIELGKHTLVARTYTITDDTGPDSSPVTVTRIKNPDNANPPTTGGGNSGGGTNQQKPDQGTGLVITSDRPFITFGPGKSAVWTGTITGGKLPYRVHIDWNDGDMGDYTITQVGRQHFAHHYRSMRPHVITIQVQDAASRSILRQYAAVTPYQPSVAATTPKRFWNGSLPIALYGAYLLVLVIFGGLWARAHPYAYALAPAPARRRAKRK